MVSGSILILAFMLFWKQILNILPHLYDGLSRTSPWRYLIQSRFKPVIWKQCIRSPFRTAIHHPFFITMTTGEQYWAGLTYFCLRFNTTRENLPFQTKYINRFLAHSAFSPNSKLPRTWGGSPGKAYLWLGGGQSEPYSWTCMPKKHKSTPILISKSLWNVMTQQVTHWINSMGFCLHLNLIDNYEFNPDKHFIKKTKNLLVSDWK